jgi:hypothetical protein
VDGLELFSWAIVALGLSGIWITGKHNWGWLMAVVFQILWTYYALAINAHALAFQSIAFGVIALRNYLVGRKRLLKM